MIILRAAGFGCFLFQSQAHVHEHEIALHAVKKFIDELKVGTRLRGSGETSNVFQRRLPVCATTNIHKVRVTQCDAFIKMSLGRGLSLRGTKL